MKAFFGWLLATASLIMGLLVFLAVIGVLPRGPAGDAIGGILTFLAFLFGEAAPTIGRIVLAGAKRQLGL